MKIIVKTWSRGRDRNKEEEKPNILYLYRDNWDDFGVQTRFHVYYNNTSLGLLNIIKVGQQKGPTLEPCNIESLSDDYCSLGEQMYYEALMLLSEKEKVFILENLQDCIYNQSMYEKFKDEYAFQNSILRGRDWGEHLSLCKGILDASRPRKIAYKITITAKHNKGNFDISMDSTPDEYLPSNIHVLIGRNGVGKTELLTGIYDEYFNVDSNQSKYYSNIELSVQSIEDIIYVDLNEQKDTLNNENRNKIRVRDISVEYFREAVEICFSRKDLQERWGKLL